MDDESPVDKVNDGVFDSFWKEYYTCLAFLVKKS
jgi:hypothetical protein